MSACERRLLHLRLPPGIRLADAGTDPAREADTSAGILDRWTPAWEVADGGVHLDLTGTGRLWGRSGDGAARVCAEAARHWPGLAAGSASSRLAAALASRLAARRRGSADACLCVVPAGSDAAFLAHHSLAVLGDGCPGAALLRDLGVRTLGDLQLVPETLLVATLGEAGRDLHAEAWGRDRRPLQRLRPAGRVLLTVALARPLEGAPCEAALRAALTARAQRACPEGPGAWEWWQLRAWWGAQGRQAVSLRGRGEGTLAGWRAQVEALWARLRRRRAGLSRLELVAGPYRGAPPSQPVLFPEADRLRRLGAAWRRAAELAPRALFWGSEALLERWGARWEEGPEVDRAAQKRVGWLLPSAAGSDGSGPGKSARSSG